MGDNQVYRRVCDQVLAPCCWHESLAVHRSPEAESLRKEVAAMAAQGKQEREILDALIARYGRRILRVPEGNAANLLLAVPAAALAVGGVALVWFLKRRRTAVAPADGPAVEVDDSEFS